MLPVALYNKALNIAHEGHLGITRTKTLLRSMVWFPNINSLVDSLISKCLPCELNSKGMFEPIKSSSLPKEVWDELSIDFFGPLPNGCELLVLIDDYSRNAMVEEIKTTAAKYVVPVLDNIFSFFWYSIDLEK